MSNGVPKTRVAIVIPTYNEAGNIGRLLLRLADHIFPLLPLHDLHIIVVDGNSSDGTAGIVEELMQTRPFIHLIREAAKSGIGAAYLEGFSYAMKSLAADAVVEFDADFQHPPEIIPALLGKIDQGYDYVLGSRRIPDASEPADRDFLRRFLTRAGGLLARLILFFPGRHFREVTDPTTGLKATRVRDILDRLDLRPDHLYSKKFGYKVQLLSETLRTGARYAEIPLNFQNRAAGSSKFSSDTTWEILLACLRTRFNL